MSLSYSRILPLLTMCLDVDFESTFAPEIAIFMPPQPVREVNSSPTPSWIRSPPSTNGPLPPLQKPAPLLANGAITEEVKIVQPVSIRQGRGARLSFLGGRKKDQAPPPPVPQLNGDHSTEADSSLGRSRSINKDNRRSFFRGHAPSESARSNGTEMSPAVWSGPRTDVSGTDWVSDSAPRESGDLHMLEKEKSMSSDHSSGGVLHVGNVRKRLSILRLGKKSSKGNGIMGSLDEE